MRTSLRGPLLSNGTALGFLPNREREALSSPDVVKDNTGNAVKNWGVSIGIGVPVGANNDDGS